MSTKTSIATLLLLSATLLTGCICYRTVPNASQVTEEKIEQADEQQDTRSQITVAQRREDLRLANERAKLAEEKAELEKQKREFAEKRLGQQNKSDEDENPEEPSEDEGTGGS